MRSGTYRALVPQPTEENVMALIEKKRKSQYCIPVQFDALERRSLFSTVIAPTNLVGTVAASAAINLSWQDNSANEAGFAVERSGDGTYFSQIATTAANATGFQDTALTPGFTYYYHIRAIDGAGGGSDYSNTASVWLPTPSLPSAPTNLTVTLKAGKKGQSSAVLNWQDNSNNEERFYVGISTDGVHWTTLTDVAANGTTCSLSGLRHGTTYYFRVAAYNTAGYSAWSNTAIAVP
jgi:hypothetical protein